MTTRYLTKEEILAIHRDQIERYGGSHGLKEEGYLESAIGRLETGYYENLTEEAAAFWESLAGNHAFHDGNKRTALMSVRVFLGLNDKEITAEQEATIDFIDERYEKEEMDFDHLKSWLDENTKDRDSKRSVTERVAPTPQVTRESQAVHYLRERAGQDRGCEIDRSEDERER